MILRKAPPIYKRGDRKTVTKFAFKPIQLIEHRPLDPATYEKLPDIISEVIWLERYVETLMYTPKEGKNKSDWTFIKSERYGKAFLNKLCE
jgi:hypothetical protein